MTTYLIGYTDLDTWIQKQRTKNMVCEVSANSEEEAIEWFEENIQGDYDFINVA